MSVEVVSGYALIRLTGVKNGDQAEKFDEVLCLLRLATFHYEPL
jgi:hypothetical protein